MGATYAELQELLGDADDLLTAAEIAFDNSRCKVTAAKLSALRKHLEVVDDELDDKPDTTRAQALKSQLEAIRDRIGELHERARNRRANTTRDGIPSPWEKVARLLASIFQFVLTLLGLPLFAVAVEGVRQVLTRE